VRVGVGWRLEVEHARARAAPASIISCAAEAILTKEKGRKAPWCPVRNRIPRLTGFV
jgi:hypothetical protein